MEGSYEPAAEIAYKIPLEPALTASIQCPYSCMDRTRHSFLTMGCVQAVPFSETKSISGPTSKVNIAETRNIESIRRKCNIFLTAGRLAQIEVGPSGRGEQRLARSSIFSYKAGGDQ